MLKLGKISVETRGDKIACAGESSGALLIFF